MQKASVSEGMDAFCGFSVVHADLPKYKVWIYNTKYEIDIVSKNVRIDNGMEYR